jgi:hypothetical protein
MSPRGEGPPAAQGLTAGVPMEPNFIVPLHSPPVWRRPRPYSLWPLS